MIGAFWAVRAISMSIARRGTTSLFRCNLFIDLAIGLKVILQSQYKRSGHRSRPDRRANNSVHGWMGEPPGQEHPDRPGGSSPTLPKDSVARERRVGRQESITIPTVRSHADQGV